MTAEVIELGIRVGTHDLQTAEGRFDATSRAAKRTQDQFRKTGGAAAQAAKDMQRLIDQAKMLVGYYFGAQGIRQIITYADTYKQLQGRLALVSTSTAQQIALEARLFDVSQRTRSGYEATVQLYTRIAMSAKNLGKSHEDLLRITETVNKAMQIGGASTAEASAGVIQLSQALASGTLRGDEFRSVLENMPRVATILEDALGKTRGELIQMAADGKLSSKVVADALLGASTVIDAEFGKLPKTIGQALTNLEGAFIRLIGQSSAMGTATQMLSGFIGDLAENLEAVTEAILLLAGAYILARIYKLITAMSTLNAVMAVNPFAILVTGIAGVIVYFGGLEKVILSLQATYVSFNNEFQKGVVRLAGAASALYEGFAAVFKRLGELFEAFAQDFKNFIENPTEGIKFDNLAAVWSKGMGSAFSEAYSRIKDTQKDMTDEMDRETEAKIAELAVKMDALNKSGLPSIEGAPSGSKGGSGGIDTARAKELEKAREIMDDYLQGLKDEVMLAGLTAKEREKVTAVLTLEKRLKEQNVTLDEKTRDLIIQQVEARQKVEEIQKRIEDIAKEFNSTMEDGLKSIFKNGKDGWGDMLDGWEDMLYSWMAKTINQNFFSPIFDALAKGLGSALSGGSGGGGSFLSFLGSMLPSFDVGTSNVPRDMKAQIHKGEMIIPEYDASLIRRGALGGQSARVTVNVINNADGTTTRQEERDDGMGGKTIDVFIDEAVAKNLRKSGSQTRQAMRQEFGAQQRLVNRG